MEQKPKEVKLKQAIMDGKTALGVELGSTRIKAVLMDENYQTIASGSYEWENKLEDGFWTYDLAEVWEGIQSSYRQISDEVYENYGERLTKVQALGFSAMMHGYLAFNSQDELIVPFRTWRNTRTAEAEQVLTKELSFNIPQRWSIAHFYQAILNQEKHVKQVSFLTTLAGYVHWQLTGEKVIGIGDASGMFPINLNEQDYDFERIRKFEQLAAEHDVTVDLMKLLPKVLVAGHIGGKLTAEGATLLDPTGHLQPGIALCPPEGDAGTGMVATNSVAPRSGNISAGTSAFAMLVLEKELTQVYPEIDRVVTPSGEAVAMVHTNNCTSDLNAWIKLFREFTNLLGVELTTERLFTLLFQEAIKGEPDCGGLVSYGYLSGENITKVQEGRPLFVRTPESRFSLANFMRAHLASSFATMRLGMDIVNQENIQIDQLVGHGGIFKTPEVAQRMLASALEAPVTVMETAGEGGAWGMAVLSMFMVENETASLAEYLEKQVFADAQGTTIEATEEEKLGYQKFVARYAQGLELERLAQVVITDGKE